MAERIKELEKAIKEFRSKRLDTMRSHTAEYISALTPMFQKALNTVIKRQLQRQLEDDEAKIKHLYFCRLYTSEYTGSCGAILGMSDSGMYLDEGLSQTNWYLSPLYINLEKDMEAVKKLLQRTFIRLQESELFAMKKSLSDDSWVLAESCFCTLVRNNFNLIKESGLRLEDETLILCGDYMDNLKIISTKVNNTTQKKPESLT